MCLPPTTYEATDRELRAFYEAGRRAAACRSWRTTTRRRRGSDMPADADRRPCRASSPSRSARATRAGSPSCSSCATTSRSWSGATTGRWRATPPAPSAGCPASPTCCRRSAWRSSAPCWAATSPRPARSGRASPRSPRLDMDPRLVQSFKAALDLTGHYGGPVRPPRLDARARRPGAGQGRAAAGRGHRGVGGARRHPAVARGGPVSAVLAPFDGRSSTRSSRSPTPPACWTGRARRSPAWAALGAHGRGARSSPRPPSGSRRTRSWST